jgi:enolase-phosphatase E1
VPSNIKCILTDIEGTTTSISFVYDVLFPYFKEHINELKSLTQNNQVIEAFSEVKKIVSDEENQELTSDDQVIEKLLQWSNEDRKITPLKTLQGILWKEGYVNGILKGHVYEDVPLALRQLQEEGICFAVFSSGSVAAQKLIFGFSDHGDLTPYFKAYFDTTTGMKRDSITYTKIAKELGYLPNEILFLSDIYQELEAAELAGMKTTQILRKGTEKAWGKTAVDFVEVRDSLDSI